MPLPPANYDALLKELAELLVIMVHHCMEAMGNAEANQMKKTCWEILFLKTKHTKSYKTLKWTCILGGHCQCFALTFCMFWSCSRMRVIDFVSDFCFVVVVVFSPCFPQFFLGFFVQFFDLVNNWWSQVWSVRYFYYLYVVQYISCNFGTNCAAKYLSPNTWGMFFGEGVRVDFVCVGLGWGWGGD